ncbi:hypothetical protein CJA_2513 [Cellvibrio japonicus Ueda107]|uniref:Uncharacterized protein n=1 Tax=Cellvibrio japonicus (strain Ueda107) TaxID=498211 RepID=B3PL00_CELJU|nr:hypothetical protein CJA_2513 [Cellvibrio japonicus Ueda107]
MQKGCPAFLSTGQLILERSGLKDEEISSRVDIGLGEDDKYFYYRLMLRGPADYDLNIGAINRHKNWADWAEEYRLAEPLRKREADVLSECPQYVKWSISSPILQDCNKNRCTVRMSAVH